MRPRSDVSTAALRHAKRWAHIDHDAYAAGTRLLRANPNMLEQLAQVSASPPSGNTKSMTVIPSELAPIARFLVLHAAQADPHLGSIIWHRSIGGYEMVDDAFRVMSASLMQRRSRPLRITATGGSQIGVGRDGTRVYTPDDLLIVYPTTAQALLVVHTDGAGKKTNSNRSGWTKRVVPIIEKLEEDRVVLKDIPNGDDGVYESMINAMVHEWARKSNVLHNMTVHPTFNALDIKYQVMYGVEVERRIITLRRMKGDISTLLLRPREVLQLAMNVLTSLCVFHANGYMHMDIKPYNIMYELTTDPNNRYNFVLGDYGLIARTTAVCANALRGGSPSGTDGYISPLLFGASDEAAIGNEHAFHKFHTAANITHAMPSAQLPTAFKKITEYWKRLFARKRAVLSPEVVPKADLHSLGLTLMYVAKHDATVWEKEHVAGVSLKDVLGRLMFFRNGDFNTAIDALKYVESRVKMSSRHDDAAEPHLA